MRKQCLPRKNVQYSKLAFLIILSYGIFKMGDLPYNCRVTVKYENKLIMKSIFYLYCVIKGGHHGV